MNVNIPRGAKVIPVTNNHHKPHILLKGLEMKHCPRCSLWQPLSSFWTHNAHWDALQCHCKDCVIEQNEQVKRRKG